MWKTRIELTTEERFHLQGQNQKTGRENSMRGRGSKRECAVIKIYVKWGEAGSFAEKYHPGTVVANRAIKCLKIMLWPIFERFCSASKKQQTLDGFIVQKNSKRKPFSRTKTTENAGMTVLLALFSEVNSPLPSIIHLGNQKGEINIFLSFSFVFFLFTSVRYSQILCPFLHQNIKGNQIKIYLMLGSILICFP